MSGPVAKLLRQRSYRRAHQPSKRAHPAPFLRRAMRPIAGACRTNLLLLGRLGVSERKHMRKQGCIFGDWQIYYRHPKWHYHRRANWMHPGRGLVTNQNWDRQGRYSFYGY